MDFSEFLAFLEARQSVRKYDAGTGVTDEEVAAILKAASSAPSAGNLEALDVILVMAGRRTSARRWPGPPTTRSTSPPRR
jgi:nitroreductase